MAIANFDDYLSGSTSNRNAWDMLNELLNNSGLSDLTDFAQQQLVNGRTGNDVLYSLREQDSYKKRFQVIEQRKAAGLPPVSEAEVLSYEAQATQAMRSAGIPSGFWDQPEDFVKLQVNDISVPELISRVNEGYVAYNNAPQDVRDEMRRLGFTAGDAVATFLDPDRAQNVIMNNFGAAQRAAEAQRAGFTLDVDQARLLQQYGTTAASGTQGFNELANQREFMDKLPGQADEAVTQEEALKATFGGDAAAQKKIKDTASRRAANFQGGGGFASGQDGFAGIGTAR